MKKNVEVYIASNIKSSTPEFYNYVHKKITANIGPLRLTDGEHVMYWISKLTKLLGQTAPHRRLEANQKSKF